MTDPTREADPSPEDSIRIHLDELGRGTIATPPDVEDSALAPIAEPANHRCRQSQREIAQNAFPAEGE